MEANSTSLKVAKLIQDAVNDDPRMLDDQVALAGIITREYERVPSEPVSVPEADEVGNAPAEEWWTCKDCGAKRAASTVARSDTFVCRQCLSTNGIPPVPDAVPQSGEARQTYADGLNAALNVISRYWDKHIEFQTRASGHPVTEVEEQIAELYNRASASIHQTPPAPPSSIKITYINSETGDESSSPKAELAPAECEWKSDDEGIWWTTCDNAFVFEVDGPKENKMKFCCYCGRTLKESQNG